MDAQQFLAEFGQIANAPNGIPQLRELVLCLAMQGKLIPQDPDESTAAELLAVVEQDRARLISCGAIKSPKPWPEIDRSDISHVLPSNWAWVRFGEVAMHNSGKTLDSVRNKGLPRDYITTSNLYWGRFELGNVKKMLIREDELDKCTARKNDLLICEGGEAGRAAVWAADTEVCFQNHVHRARFYGGINPFFACRFFEKLNYTGEINAHRKGIGISNMSSKALAMIPFPLPPIEEQSRIVAKADELMALCDKLEAQQQAHRKLQNKLRQSTLQALASATSPHELQVTWARLADNFGRLFHAPEDVAEIKSLILDLAIQGRLTARSFEDEAADLLIGRSLAAKRGRLASGEMKNKKPAATDITDVEINVPPHWTRASLDDLFQFIDYRGKTPTKTNSGVVLVTAKNVRPGFIATEPIEYLSESSYQEWMTRGFPRIGDLLITTEAPLGNVARIEEQPSFALAQRVIDLQPFADINTKCAMYFMMSPLFQSLLEENSTGMTAKGIKAGKLKQLLLPIPPKEEQHRIVQRVEELMKICAVLSSQVEAARKQSARLAVASVSSLTGIAIEQEEEPMKAPRTELIALLRLGTAPDIKAQAPLATILARHNGEMSAKDLWQRFGGEIDTFYAQLKTEVAHGWILEPTGAEMREKQAEAVSA